MPLKLSGSTSGTVTLDTPAVAGSNTLILPAVTGNVITNQDSGTVTPTMMSQKLTLMTAQNTTAGTSIDFTSIPSWAKRITVVFNGVSTSGTSNIQLQIGNGSVVTTGYTSYVAVAGGTNVAAGNTSTTGFLIDGGGGTAASIRSGIATIVNIGSNTWVYSVSGGINVSSVYYSVGGGGSIALAGALDRVRLTTVNGTDTFDLGSINVMYEG